MSDLNYSIKLTNEKENTMSNFTPNEKTIKIMKNFAEINPSMLIEPTKLSVINSAKSIIANYVFETKNDFTQFGLFDTNEVHNIIKALGKPEIEVFDKYINIIGANDDKVKYFTSAANLVPVVPNLDDKFSKVNLDLEFTMSAEKLAIIAKMQNLLKAKYLFFESDTNRVRITIGEALESSYNNYEVYIEDNITTNNIDGFVKILTSDLKLLAGEYKIKMSSKITKWINVNGVSYYITTAA
jgi:hypothetical protein